MFLSCFFLPHSPAWLVSKRRYEEAEYARKRLQGPARESTLSFKETEQFWDLFSRKLVLTTLCPLLVQLVVQLTETAVFSILVHYLGAVIRLQDTHMFVTEGLLKAIPVVFAFLPLLWLDRCRRKDVIVYGTFLVGCSFAALWTVLFFYGRVTSGGYFVLYGKPASTALAVVALVAAVLSATIAGAGWLYTMEVFSDAHKPHVMGLLMAFLWLFNATIAFGVEYLVHTPEHWVMAVFAAIHLLSCVVFLQLPETKPEPEKPRQVYPKVDVYFHTGLEYRKSPVPSVEGQQKDCLHIPLTGFGDSGDKAAKNLTSPNNSILTTKISPALFPDSHEELKKLLYGPTSPPKQANPLAVYEDLPLSHTILHDPLSPSLAVSPKKGSPEKETTVDILEKVETEFVAFTEQEDAQLDAILESYTEDVDSLISASSRDSFYSDDWIAGKNQKYVRHRVPTVLRNSKTTVRGEATQNTGTHTSGEGPMGLHLGYRSMGFGTALGGNQS